MSLNRSTFILTGGGLLTLAILGITAREFQLGPMAAHLVAWSPLVAYGTFGAAGLLGALLLVFAPSSRRVEHRVRLDRPDAANPVMARPSAGSKAPTTRGMSTSTPARNDPTRPDSVHNQKPRGLAPGASRAAGPASPQATGAQGAAGPSGPATTRTQEASWVHPNDSGREQAAPAGSAGSAGPAGKPSSPSPPPPRATLTETRRPPAPASPLDGATPGPAEDPAALRARLEELDRQANHAKVRYGLGQLSGNGYRQVLAKIDEARAHIEQTLLGDLEV